MQEDQCHFKNPQRRAPRYMKSDGRENQCPGAKYTRQEIMDWAIATKGKNPGKWKQSKRLGAHHGEAGRRHDAIQNHLPHWRFKMKTKQDQRQYERVTVPVVIQAPGLSDLPLVPEDVSAGGFKVVVTQEPSQHASIECSLQFGDEVFDNCNARVVWVSKNEGPYESWDVGLTIKTLIEDRDFLDITLHKAYKGLK
jgi:hypothetical protein